MLELRMSDFDYEMASNLLIFIPQELCSKQSGYMLGKVIHDEYSDLKKIYVITVCKANPQELSKSTLSVIGYYSNTNNATREPLDSKSSDWIQISVSENGQDSEYYPTNIVLNNKRLNPSMIHTTIILYDQQALQETELFEHKVALGNHFYELVKLIQSKKDELKDKSRFVYVYETLLLCHVVFYLYPILFLSKITEKLLPLLKCSSLGLHIYDWLRNLKWMLVTIIQNKGFKLNTGNYALAIITDVALGIFVLGLLEHYVENTLPSQLLLNNAEAS
jgi:hypothetical protein